jgi:C-terminal processing protease CtpA/Prc
VLLKVAQELASAVPKPSRTIVFVAFSGEELGLYGSRHYTSRPVMPINAAITMLNMDMVGRLRDNRLTVFGTRSADQLSAVVSEEAARLALEVRESDAIGRSDNLSFYNKEVPAVHFFTGMHSDYHRPSDTWEKLNYQGMERIANLVLAVTRRLANSPATPVFAALPSRPPGSRSGEEPSFRSYFGSIPDYEGGGKGVKLAGVAPGSPAAKAGLRRGDIITRFAGAPIENLEDLMGELNSKKPGDEVEIVVRRAETNHTLKATLTARN